MDWLNLKFSTLRAIEFLGSEVAQRGTWLTLLAFCGDQENGGRIVGARQWTDRAWQQVCGVTLAEVSEGCALFRWEGDDLVMWEYPREKETEVQARRRSGSKGGAAKTQAKTQAAQSNGAKGGRPSSSPNRVEPEKTQAPSAEEPKQNPSNNPTEEEMEEEMEERIPRPPLEPAGAAPGKKRVEKKAAPEPEKLPSDPRHQAFVRAYVTIRNEVCLDTPGGYVFEGGKDGAALKGFLFLQKALSVEQFSDVVRRVLLHRKQEQYAKFTSHAGTLSGLCRKWNDILGELDAYSGRNGRPAHLAARVSQEFPEPELKPTVFRP